MVLDERANDGALGTGPDGTVNWGGGFVTGVGW